MWELDYKESWVLKNWCFWTVVLEKTLESPLDCKEIQTLHSKGDQSWIFIGRSDAEAETPILWPSDAKNWLTGKTLMLGRLKVRGEGDDRGWDGCMASLTQWTWVWVNSGSQRWRGRPGLLQSMGSQRVKHDLVTELNWNLISDWIHHWVQHCVYSFFLIYLFSIFGCAGSLLLYNLSLVPVSRGGYSLVEMLRILIRVASLVEYRLYVHELQWLQGSRIQAQQSWCTGIVAP